MAKIGTITVPVKLEVTTVHVGASPSLTTLAACMMGKTLEEFSRLEPYDQIELRHMAHNVIQAYVVTPR